LVRPLRYWTYDETDPHELTRNTRTFGSPLVSVASSELRAVPNSVTRLWSLPSQRMSPFAWRMTRPAFSFTALAT
jgi:hypothetical protein